MAKTNLFYIEIAKGDSFSLAYGKNGRYDFYFDGEGGIEVTDTKKDETIFDGTIKDLKRLGANGNVEASPSKSLQSLLDFAIGGTVEEPHKTETAF